VLEDREVLCVRLGGVVCASVVLFGGAVGRFHPPRWCRLRGRAGRVRVGVVIRCVVSRRRRNEGGVSGAGGLVRVCIVAFLRQCTDRDVRL
jgi:hypothetical protein